MIVEKTPDEIIDKVGDTIPDTDDEIIVGGVRKRRMLKEENKRIILPKHKVIKGDKKESSFSRKLRQLKS